MRRLTIALLLALLVPANEAGAFTAQVEDYYATPRWPTGVAVTWSFADNFPGGSYRTRVADAFASWNALGEPLDFSGPGTDAPANGSRDCLTATRRVVMWEPLEGSTAGTAWTCSTVRVVAGVVQTSAYKNFEIVLDSDRHSSLYGTIEWWRSLSDIPPAPPYYRDLWSYATHEVGHVVGQSGDGVDGHGHFDNNSTHTCPRSGDANYLDRESMCAKNLVNTRVGRNPAAHEVHMFRLAY